MSRAHRVAAQVVAVERDVELADGDRGPLDLLDAGRQAAGKRDPARGDAEEDEPLAALVALEDLVTDAPKRPGDVSLAHDVASVLRDARAVRRCLVRCARVGAGHRRWTSFP